MTVGPVLSLDELEARVVSWAQARPDIRAAIVVGSRARTDHPADEWADLDVGFMTTNQRRYLSSGDWLGEIAPVCAWYPDATGVTRRVLFEGGFDAGLAPVPATAVKLAVRLLPTMRRLPFLFRLVPGGQRMRVDLKTVAEYYRRGSRIIVDKDGAAAKFLAMFPPERDPHRLPSQDEFTATVNEFWFITVWTAKHLRRGELWWAKTNGCDGRMKSLLLRMIEWQAWAAHGPEFDTWESGRFLEEWGDLGTLESLRSAFAHYDSADIRSAILSTMDVFRTISTATANSLGLAYPTDVDANVTDWVRDCLGISRQPA